MITGPSTASSGEVVAVGEGVKAVDVFTEFGENIEMFKRLVRAAIGRVAACPVRGTGVSFHNC